MDQTSSDREPDRIAALARYHMMHTPPEFAAEICGCPIATKSLIDEHRR
jgi:adenylate cyclase